MFRRNPSWIWLVAGWGGDSAAGGSAAGYGHMGELLRPRFHMLCRLQLPEDQEIKRPNCAPR